ncbi:MAG: flavin reductase family protein [Acidaminococcaceae bacterium]|nr:flavin reductase family protein [Acidaminococcaceae bacterium]MDD4721728.1 flavin reductase family protein [Acidaminococcaceae bacterium]
MTLQKLPLEKSFMFLESGPVLLVTTRVGRKNNVMTISWHMVLDFTPLLALKTGPWNYSFAALLEQRECVLCVPAIDLAEKTVRIGAISGEKVDKLKKFGLNVKKAETVKPPLLEDCLFCLECRVVDYIEAYGIIVLEGKQAWYNTAKDNKQTFHANGDGTFIVDGKILNYRNIMKDKIPPGV